MSKNRLLTAFGIIDIAVGIAVWAATGSALVGIVIILVGILLLALPAMQVRQHGGGKPPSTSEHQPPSEFEGQPPSRFEGEPSASDARRASKTEGKLDKARAEQQRLHDETAAAVENAEDRPPPTGA